MNQNLQLYRVFNTVVETGSISAAAKKLYISQPAISKSINGLESALEVQLFTRSSRGVTLTDEGRLLYNHVSEAFRFLTEGELELKRYMELGIGQLRIGTSTTLCKFRLLPYLHNFIDAHPHISFNISCQSTRQTTDLLNDNRIDIGLVAKSNYIHDDSYFPIGHINDVFVATPVYLANLRKRYPVDAEHLLSSATLMLLDKQNLSRQYIDHYLDEHNIAPINLIEATTMDLLIEFAKTGLGIACVIREFVQEELQNKQLVEIPLASTIKEREIGFLWSGRRPKSHALADFITYVKSIQI